MTTTTAVQPASTLDRQTCESVTGQLQDQLSELLTLTLQAKHAHWNVYGEQFRPVHLQLDDITADLRLWSDTVAERIVTLGVPARGQAATLGDSGIDPLPDRPIPAHEAVTAMAERLTMTAIRGRERAKRLGDQDLVSQSVLLDIIQGLEKHIWMLRAQFDSYGR